MVNPALLTFDSCTHLRVRKLSRLVSKMYDAELAPLGIKATQFSLMQHLGCSEPVCASVLASLMVMDPSTMTRGLRPLLDKGWVMQEPGVDSRRHVLRLTPEGRQALVTVCARWSSVQDRMQALFGHAELEALHSTLDRACERLQAGPS